jgi:hypothetical protein
MGLTYGITGDTMLTRKKLEKIRREIESYRRGIHNVRTTDLVSLASSLGRKRVNRGSEPTYESEVLPNAHAITIPGHPKINPWTAKAILTDLEADIDACLAELEKEELKKKEEQESNVERKALPPAPIRKNPNSR